MASRVTQQVIEVLSTTAPPAIRVTQVVLEVLSTTAVVTPPTPQPHVQVIA